MLAVLRLLLLVASITGLHVGSPFHSHAPSRAAVARMQEVAVNVDEPAKAESSMNMNEETPSTERFIAIHTGTLEKWAEKFPRLQEHLADIQRSALIFPFKASPYLVEELIDWDREGTIKDDPFYRLIFPTMDMLSEEHQDLLNAACDP